MQPSNNRYFTDINIHHSSVYMKISSEITSFISFATSFEGRHSTKFYFHKISKTSFTPSMRIEIILYQFWWTRFHFKDKGFNLLRCSGGVSTKVLFSLKKYRVKKWYFFENSSWRNKKLPQNSAGTARRLNLSSLKWESLFIKIGQELRLFSSIA